MAQPHNTNQKLPAKSIAERFGAGDPAVASPETQPRETAMRNATTGKQLHTQFKRSQSTGLTPP